MTDLPADFQTRPVAEERLHEVDITVNRNAVPFDPRPPAVSSWLTSPWSDDLRSDLAERARALAERHPLYPRLLQTI